MRPTVKQLQEQFKDEPNVSVTEENGHLVVTVTGLEMSSSNQGALGEESQTIIDKIKAVMEPDKSGPSHLGVAITEAGERGNITLATVKISTFSRLSTMLKKAQDFRAEKTSAQSHSVSR